MYCSKCSKEIPDKSEFCPYCGSDLRNKNKILYTVLMIIILVVIIAGVILVKKTITGVEDKQLPNFIGLTLEQAEQKANELGLKLNIIEESSSKVEKGKIINQDPTYQESYTIKEGTTINLVVSLGKK